MCLKGQLCLKEQFAHLALEGGNPPLQVPIKDLKNYIQRIELCQFPLGEGESHVFFNTGRGNRWGL